MAFPKYATTWVGRWVGVITSPLFIVINMAIIGAFMGVHQSVHLADDALKNPCKNTHRHAMASMQVPLADPQDPTAQPNENPNPTYFYTALGSGGFRGWFADLGGGYGNDAAHSLAKQQMSAFVSIFAGHDKIAVGALNAAQTAEVDFEASSDPELDNLPSAVAGTPFQTAQDPVFAQRDNYPRATDKTHGANGRYYAMFGDHVADECYKPKYEDLDYRMLGYWNKINVKTDDPAKAADRRRSKNNAGVEVDQTFTPCEGEYCVAGSYSECVEALQYVFNDHFIPEAEGPKGGMLNGHTANNAYKGFLACTTVLLFLASLLLRARPDSDAWENDMKGKSTVDSCSGYSYQFLGSLLLIAMAIGVYAGFHVMEARWELNLAKAGFHDIQTTMTHVADPVAADKLPKKDGMWLGPVNAMCGMHLIYPADLGNMHLSAVAAVPLSVRIVGEDVSDPKGTGMAQGSPAGFATGTATADALPRNQIFSGDTATFGTLSNSMSCTDTDAAGTAFESCPGRTVRTAAPAKANAEDDAVDPNPHTDEGDQRSFYAGNVQNNAVGRARVTAKGLRHLCMSDQYDGIERIADTTCDTTAALADDQRVNNNLSIDFFTQAPRRKFRQMLITWGSVMIGLSFILQLIGLEATDYDHSYFFGFKMTEKDRSLPATAAQAFW